MTGTAKALLAAFGLSTAGVATVIVLPVVVPLATPLLVQPESELAIEPGRFNTRYFLNSRTDRTAILMDCASGMRHGSLCISAQEAERIDPIPQMRTGELSEGAKRALAILGSK